MIIKGKADKIIIVILMFVLCFFVFLALKIRLWI
jgi:hypothetical protein